MVGWYLGTCALKCDHWKKKILSRSLNSFIAVGLSLSHVSSGFQTTKCLSSHFCSWYFLFFNVQIIEASQFSSGTKTFGYSLAGNLDVDNNGYPGRGLRFLTHSPFLAISIPLSPVSSTPPSLPYSLTQSRAFSNIYLPVHPIIQLPTN